MERLHMEYEDGFVAGTLVHTNDGLKPIGDIEVGDFVLSHTEDPLKGTERGYKRVIRTVSFEDRQVLQFCWCRNYGDGEFDHAFATPNPLVWSYPQGWLPIGKVPYTSSGSEEWFGRNLVMADGSVGERYEINGVYTTKNKNVAYVHCDGFGSGNYVDLSLSPHRFLKEDEESRYESGREDQDSDDWLAYTTKVCHLEVEGWHTFFVGKTGLLVHDTALRLATVPTHLVDVDSVR
ncbi:MAG: hypothetical protein HEQ39_01070 [Rhizobacter sp.]